MELDLSELRIPLVGLAATLLLACLGYLGHAYQPSGDRLLTRSEWQILKARRLYGSELKDLQVAAETLAALLNADPDPVRAQIAAERIQRLASEGQPSLEYQREKLALAAQAVSAWSVGAATRSSALEALDDALRSLSAPPTPQGTPVPGSAYVEPPSMNLNLLPGCEAVHAW